MSIINKIFAIVACSLLPIIANAFNPPPVITVSKEILLQDPTPYLLPTSHRIYPTMQSIFSNDHILDNQVTFRQAGFKTLFFRKKNALRVAYHPNLPGYLFKVYLFADKYPAAISSGQNKLVQRCIGAAIIKNVIKKKKIKHFVMTDKWLYEIFSPYRNPDERVFVLVVKDMNIMSRKDSSKAWKTKITRSHLRELLILLRTGIGSLCLSQNIPYTTSGKFAFIDTEYPARAFEFPKVALRVAPKMGDYWLKLLKKHRLLYPSLNISQPRVVDIRQHLRRELLPIYTESVSSN